MFPPQAWKLSLMLACSAAGLGATAPSAAFDRFMERQNEPLYEYRAYRRLTAETAKLSRRASLEAWTELREGLLRYAIVHEEGAESVRTRVLRAALRAEAKAFEEGGAERGRLSAANYEFGAPETMPGGLVRIGLRPRRADALLLDGAAILSADGDLLRLEGQPAKKPSFWISRLRIVREYARIGSARVPVRVFADASLKLAGAATFEMTYEYESINGLPITVSAGRRWSYRSWAPQVPH